MLTQIWNTKKQEKFVWNYLFLCFPIVAIFSVNFVGGAYSRDSNFQFLFSSVLFKCWSVQIQVGHQG